MLLNQQQALFPDTSIFALFIKKQEQRPFRGRGPYHAKFSERSFNPRPPVPASAPAARFSNTTSRFNTSYAPRFSTSPSAPMYNNSTGILPQPGLGQTFPFNSAPPQIPCQICGKINHQALDYYNKMDYSFQGRHPPPQLAAMVAQSKFFYKDPQWFADSAANAHII